MALNSKIPHGPVDRKWTDYKDHVRLVNPANKRSIDILVIGSGLAGSSAAASLAEMGYSVKCFCFQDSPRRAHSIAAQGGINAAKNYKNDGDSTYRLFYDTIKGGDYRAREANVHRLAEVSANIIDQCVAQGVPFAREYGGLLDNRSFGGTQVQRTFYAAGQTGQQLLLGAYSALSKEIAKGSIKMYNRHEMLDVVKVNGKARGIIARNLVTGEIERHSGHAVLLVHRRLRQRVLPQHQCHGQQRDCRLESPQTRCLLRQSLLHADPPYLHPCFGRPSEQTDFDVRVAPQ
jgi:succinate dehydrogenase / fumarate reductase flavoprotein subunit